MTAVPETQFKWHDGLNGVWLLEDSEGIATRAGVERLFALLVANKEISSLMSATAAESGPGLPDFEVEAPSASDLEDQITAMLAAQLELARNVCAEDPFCVALGKRLAVLRRVFHAVRYKHNEQAKQVCDPMEVPAQPSEPRDWPERTGSGSQALVEMGVMTGLSLMFALLKNTWKQPDSVGLADEVMQTAIDVVRSLPPLTLANEGQLTALGVRGLDQVSTFLRTAALPESGATARGQLLAVELLLALAVQRGSLGPVLDWIRLVLTVSAATPAASLRWAVLAPALQRIRQAPVTPTHQTNERSDEGSVPAYRAGILLLEEVSALACELDPAHETAANTSTATSCQVYVCGSNSSHQVGEESQEKILVPRLARAFDDVGQVEAGQYCSFVVHTNGSLSACGKGSYGRLGLGDSSNQPQPRRVDIDGSVRYVSSSKGSDGHSLALTVDGRVFSWGDGDYGKLGHGNCTTQKQPRPVGGALAGRQVRAVHAGYRHSAAVTVAGELFTWGEGEHGRLGHGNCSSRNSPTQVLDLRQVGEVSCGQSHTIVVSADRRTVWTFGSGENGKLGHGDTLKVMRPRVVEALQGVSIAKVAAGSQFSLALTATGQLYSWGFGSCLGLSPRDTTVVLPTLVEDLVGMRVVDVVIGDSHVLALTQDYQVFAWGNNTMGQCGLGQCTSPVARPQRMLGLDGVPIRQISAGTSHSVVWTAPPADRPVVAWHRPFCVDLATATFARLRAQLEASAAQFDAAPLPFGSRAEHHGFVGRLLALLRAHLRLALAAGVAGSVLAGEAAPLRQLLFRLLDVDAPAWLEAAVSECLAVGAAVLLPPLPERMQLLHALLPDRPQRSKGQRALLSLVLRSLDAPAHVSALLCAADLAQAGQLMSTVLAALTQQTLTQLGGSFGSRDETREEIEPLTEPLHSLLTAMRTHLLAFCTDQQPSESSLALLHSHAELVLASSRVVAETASSTLTNSAANRPSPAGINDLLLDSIAGRMLGQLLAALVLLPVEKVQSLLPRLLDLMQPLEHLSVSLQKADSSLDCDWLLDTHLTTCLLVGRCLGSRMIGSPPSSTETASVLWLLSPVMANGLEEAWYEPRQAGLLLEEWAVDKEDKDDEKAGCYAERECSPSEAALLVELMELASLSDWDPAPVAPSPAPSPLALVTRLALLALLKHCRLEAGDSGARRETVDVVFPAVLDLRRRLLAARAPLTDADDADVDKHVFEFLGMSLLSVDLTQTSTTLQSIVLWHGGDHAGELLAAVEVLESATVTVDAAGEPAVEHAGEPAGKPASLAVANAPTPIPAHVRLRTASYRLDVYFWGLRGMARLRLRPVSNAQITLRIGVKELTSTRLSQGVLNFADPIVSVELELPEEERRLPPVTISVVEWRLGRALPVGGYTLRSASTLLFPLLTPAQHSARKAECVVPSAPLADPHAPVFSVIGGPQLRKDTCEDEYPALVECYAKHKQPSLVPVTSPLFPEEKAEESNDPGEEDSGGEECSIWCCCNSNSEEAHQDVDDLRNEKVDEIEKDLDDRLDWWSKYHASRVALRDPMITLYPSELEEQPSFNHFQDWLRSFPLQRGKLAPGQDADSLRVGTFKGCARLYRWPSEHRLTPWGGDVEHDSFGGIPRNGPAEVLVRLYVVKATGLHPKDASGKADPFLQVVLGGKTILDDPVSAVPRQLDPVFGRCIEMSAVLPQDAVLTVRVMDRDRLSAADLMGETHIDIENRYWSNHRATCGLASRFNETGFNRWRDSSRPRQILSDLCRRTRTQGPVYTGGAVMVGGVVVSVARDDVVPVVQPDETLLREELALAALRRWSEVPLTGMALVPEHVETRSLFSPAFPGIEQGKLHLWVDLFPASEALTMQPAIDITPRAPEGFELRLILWNMENVPLTESDIISGKQKTDIYVKAWMLGADDEQVSDVHYNSLTGEGNFNWRFVFPFKYLSSERCLAVKRREGLETTEYKQPCKLFMQVWDNDIVSKDDFIGSLTFDLHKMPRCAPSAGSCNLDQLETSKQKQFSLFRQKRARGWWPFLRIDEDGDRDLAGKMEAEFELVTEDEAAKHPVGLGRRDPDALPMPERPESSLRWFMNPLKALQTLLCRRLKLPICLILMIIAVIFFILYYIYCLPSALALKTVNIL